MFRLIHRLQIVFLPWLVPIHEILLLDPEIFAACVLDPRQNSNDVFQILDLVKVWECQFCFNGAWSVRGNECGS